MKCFDCSHWVLARKTVYENGAEIVTYKAPEGKGHCEQLDVDTAPSFGCTDFLSAGSGGGVVCCSQKAGAPHSHWTMGPCPDCQGKGNGGTDSACHRCAGTAKVRYYDDGFVGDERTRKHPQEVAPQAGPDPGTVLNPVKKAEPFTEGSQF